MKKLFLFLFIIYFLLGLVASVCAVGPNPDNVEVFLSDVSPLNIVTGQTVTGTVKVIVTCSGDSNVQAEGAVQFTGHAFISLGICECKSIDTSALGVFLPPKIVVCDFNFSHDYNVSPGTHEIIPRVYWGGAAVGSPSASAHGGPSMTINVFEGPPTPSGNGAGNPLATSTVTGLVTTITNAIYVISYMLTALFIMIGGFMIITSSGNPEQIIKGRQIVLYTIIAFTVLVAARGIINFILILIDAPTRI